MSKVKEFSRQTVKDMRTAMAADLEKFAKKFGVNVKVGNITFTDKSFTAKVIVAVENDYGIYAREAENYMFKARMYNLPPLGTEFKDYKGKTYRIMGWKDRSRLKPVLIEELSSKKLYKVDTAWLVDMLNRNGRKV